MLIQADGSYACVAESATRFTLGESATWWEEDVDLELSSAWRTRVLRGKMDLPPLPFEFSPSPPSKLFNRSRRKLKTNMEEEASEHS
ncbi:hypothetical protein LOK49_LG15G01115 [Camellia lanceoleosa]|uniref:Uncharacterized protein n=1 Tax=Camellia lanceoleosa TaxID=1840588 RepID=A0ACC0F6V3_9ERIC|nr:hypothetical protein LOK49_LG15G01115 [Camellia lanceoleosa]